MFDPPDQGYGEYVELRQRGDSSVVLQVALCFRIRYTFPAGTNLASGGYLVLAKDLVHPKQYGDIPAVGPYSGTVANSAEAKLVDEGNFVEVAL